MNQQPRAKLWIDIAISDLVAARLLYENKQYRTSYFLFQQAVEKANKAFALITGELTEEDFNKVRHDQMKIYRKMIVQQEKKFKLFADTLRNFPEVTRHTITKSLNLHTVTIAFSTSLQSIDQLQYKDLVNISSVKLNQYWQAINQIKIEKIALLSDWDLNIEDDWKQVVDWICQFNVEESLTITNELNQLVAGKNTRVFKKELRLYLDMVIDMGFVFFTLYTCAILTIQHSSLTRYPDNEKNPLKIYTLKLPIVKKQEQFMELLETALAIMQKLVNASSK